jgi:DNA-binding IclR family transcriptional regulator
MQPLNPTLWRTCRMLSGATRIKLLRHLHEHPGQNVTAMANAAGIGISDASQELRRIQSRGLLQADHRRANLLYRIGADPQVVSAAPLLKALRSALADDPAGDGQLVAIAHGLGHPRRIAILRLLMAAPLGSRALQHKLGTSSSNLHRHLGALLDGGWIRRENRQFHYAAPVHPLAKALVKLLPE